MIVAIVMYGRVIFVYPRAYMAGLPGLPGKALALDTRIVSDTKQMTKERKKKKKK